MKAAIQHPRPRPFPSPRGDEYNHNFDGFVGIGFVFPSPRGDEYNLRLGIYFRRSRFGFRPLAGMSIIVSQRWHKDDCIGCFRPLAGMSIIADTFHTNSYGEKEFPSPRGDEYNPEVDYKTIEALMGFRPLAGMSIIIALLTEPEDIKVSVPSRG